MAEVFLKILNMSISATWLVLAVLVLRLCLKKVPRWVHVLLWGIVAARLLCPVSIESALSLIPSAETVSPDIMMDRTPEISTGIPILNAAVNPIIAGSFTPEPIASANPLQIWIPIVAAVWILGMAVMAVYTVVTYFRLYRRVRSATRLYGNIFQSAHIPSPFVLGLFRPRIYLPFGMDDGDLAHVIAHEQTHIRRRDHWWKPLGFLLLTIHWFNPLMWVAYILLCRDIELACDEKVIKELGRDQRADYSQALLQCSVNRRLIAACPLAFGEVGVRARVKNVLNYRKPAFWVIVLALIVCAAVAVCFLTDPNPSRELSMNGTNVAHLDPAGIVERILDIEDWKYSNVYVNSNNFSLTVDDEFNWVDSQAVRYFFDSSGGTYTGQLRIFPDEGRYFLTEREQWTWQESRFLLRHFLDALKYLPQSEIHQMAPADRYLIRQIEEGIPSGYERVITYSPDGVQELDGWYIHLELQPLHAANQGYDGTGEEVIHLFYGDGYIAPESRVTEWIDQEEWEFNQVTASTIHIPEFKGVTFRCTPYKITAEISGGETVLIQGMPIWNAYVTDLTGDGKPEICATVSFGSGMIDTHVVVYDYAARQEYTLWDRGIFDYSLRLENDVLLCEQYAYPSGTPHDQTGFLSAGPLLLADAGGGTGKRLVIDSPDVKAHIVSIEDRAETEQLPTDEAIEVFYEDGQYTYSFASIRSHLVMVTYYDGSSEDIGTALAAGRAAISDLDRFGIHYYAEPKVIPMESTRTNLRGLVAGYLFVPINGATYRYALAEPDPEGVTVDRLLEVVTEETPMESIVWEVYSLKEYPDMTKLLIISGAHSAWLCEYAPARQAEEGALEAVKAEGYVVEEDGRLTSGQEALEAFYQATRNGTPAFLQVAHYYTLDPNRTAPDTYEAYKQDYPALYIHELSYDGEIFVLRTQEDVRIYEYLMKYPGAETRYVLTHDDTHTWDQLWGSLLSSAMGVAIEHHTVCTVE